MSLAKIRSMVSQRDSCEGRCRNECGESHREEMNSHTADEVLTYESRIQTGKQSRNTQLCSEGGVHGRAGDCELHLAPYIRW